jgi:pathogenesis-related protein 1
MKGIGVTSEQAGKTAVRVRSIHIRILIAALGLAALTPASAQDGRGKAVSGVGPSAMAGPQAPLPQSVPAGVVTPSTGLPVASEPRDMAGMLAAHNAIRSRMGLAALGWSNTLAGEAASALTAAGPKSCTYSAARTLGSATASIYWAAPISQSDGQKTAQALSPGFVVSEWRAVGADYARITAPKARLVGCAKMMCPTKAQLWTCRYGEPPKANAAGTSTR